jgi:hypothetical protein
MRFTSGVQCPSADTSRWCKATKRKEGAIPIEASRLVVKLLSESTSVTMAVDDEY